MKMKNMFGHLVTTAAFVCAYSGAASAQDFRALKDAGKIEAQNTIAEISKDVKSITHTEKAMNQLLDTTANVLRKNGFAKEAEKVNSEWLQMHEIYFGNDMKFFKLGDHAPLNQWLSEIYNMAEASLGAEKCASYHLDDIKAINYGFPVTIHPSGDPETGKAWGMVEYAEHFVPFTTAASYWAGYFACKNLIKSAYIANMCSSSLDTFRSTIQTNIAPAVSDEIYAHFNP